MGLRGPGAKPIKRPALVVDNAAEPHPWEAEGLSRADRVIAFMESLPIISGSLAQDDVPAAAVATVLR